MRKIEKTVWNHKKIKEWCLDALYPQKCPFCGKIEKQRICSECRKKIRPVQEPRCTKCGKPIRDTQKEYCYDCTVIRHEFTEGRSIWIHKEPVSLAIYALKYQNRRIYAKAFGEEMGEQYGWYLREKKVNLIVPIPLHRKKLRARGYNQAQLLAEALGRVTEIPVEEDVLVRIKNTKPLKQLNDKERRRNIRGAFSVKKNVWAKTIVLIDDIYTTGSTLDEAARVLLKAGAEKVYFLTISIGQGY